MNFMTQQIRLVAIKSPYFSPEAYTPLHFSRTLPLNVDPVLEINRSLQLKNEENILVLFEMRLILSISFHVSAAVSGSLRGHENRNYPGFCLGKGVFNL